ncbi:MAG: PIN domain-containing protein [Verrucomicrobia bacterium]|nr:PIN domain-containing protein [Verrucomicrobiota bacterium]MDA1069383.1 PIN domain-containing protein [Verrucomicrobiota bacterium]
MELFLDTSVLLSACASSKGASRFILEEGKTQGWALVSAHYCREETKRNLHKLGSDADAYFKDHLDRRIDWRLDVLTSDDIVIYDKAKDRPVLISALSVKPAALLTLDRADFHERLGTQFYGIAIRTPGEWLMEQREAGLL